MKLSEKQGRVGLLAGVFVSLVIGFHTMLFDRLPAVFMTPAEDLDFAWYVPFASLFVLYRERRLVAASLGTPSARALLGLFPCLFLGLLGVRGIQVRFELLAFVGLLLFLPWAFFGRATAKRILFPVLFLLFCMPMASYLQPVTTPLRLFVTSISSGLLSLCGLDLVRQGTMIQVIGVIQANGEPFVLGVADPCSGLRSIYALLALGAGYGYVTQPTWFRRGIIFLLAIPLAVLGNILRIMAICVAAKAASPETAMGPVHDTMGFLVFFGALYLLTVSAGILGRLKVKGPLWEAAPEAAAPQAAEAPTGGSTVRRWLVPLAAAVIVVPTMLLQSLTPAPVVAEAPDASLPEHLTAMGESFTGDYVAPSVGETNLLVGATLAKRAYVHSNYLEQYETAKKKVTAAYGSEDVAYQKLTEAQAKKDAATVKAIVDVLGPLRESVLFRVSTVVSGADKSSLHRPELCLPSQGFTMGAYDTRRIGDVEWHVIQLLGEGDRCVSYFAYTFINQEGYRTPSHEARIWRDVWDRSVHNRVDRWVMTSVQLFNTNERLLEAILASLKEVGE